MNILQVSTSDRRGGAEGIALALRDGYARAGHGSWLAAGHPSGDDPTTLELSAKRQRVRSAIDRYRGREEFRFPATRTLLDLPPVRPDVVHAHNLHGWYFDLRTLPQLSHETNVVLTMHDSWLLTGHCAHSFACERWQSGCGSCPDLATYPTLARDGTAANWQAKARMYRDARLHVAAPSQWLLSRVSESMLTPLSSRVIPNGVDLATFSPGDKQAARLALGIPLDRPVLLFAAAGILNNPWKDWPTLRDAVAHLAQTGAPGRPTPLLVGLGEEPGLEASDSDVLSLRYLDDPAAVASVYRAADIYVHAAKADTFPTTVLEALACGLPVVATAVGGIPEQVTTEGPDATGVLVPSGDARAMAEALGTLLADDGRRETLAAAAAAAARNRFDIGMTTAAYLSRFEEIQC